MKDSFFRTMTWLHTWVGLLVCWVLLLVFFAGTLSYYRHEISLWNQPELHKEVFQSYDNTRLAEQLSQGEGYLRQNAVNAQRWLIEFPTERHPMLSYGWQQPPEPGQRRGAFSEHAVKADNSGYVTEVRESRGGNFFYRLHFDLHYISAITARWIVGFCTMFMLLAIISGIVIHKRIFKDFFSFRPGKGSRSWLDAHNVSSVLALPFHLMITYTGLITLMIIYMPWGILVNYDSDRREFINEARPGSSFTRIAAANEAAPQLPLASFLPKVQQTFAELPLKSVSVINPDDANSRVMVTFNTGEQVTERELFMVFSGTDGELLYSADNDISAAKATHDAMMSLHTARFSGPALRGLFFLLGLSGCVMIASGTLMWAVKIRQKQQKAISQGAKPSLGLRLVETLNLMFILGLPLGTVAFFYANRLLPASLPGRSQWEVHSFFILLLISGLLAIWRRDRAMWRAQLAALTAALAFLPLLNALTSPANLLSNLAAGQWQLAGFDLLALAFAALGLFAFKRLGRQPMKQTAKAQKLQAVRG
ncbi:PepSY domain-containing protein [Shewanella algae]|uniref:PepSY-associated TM helix domain-containing protein n=1 Tax=Shewanella algae TaxID=38313 RepID=UPI001183D594|nr:PepSY-associated TM helix domain-containing protein [Shewanella algae]MBO2621045.1 PepSY domain-containing protein [Shewanella algae]MBO2637864.1 PepSY domain-containing protein [Shewanella algae]MBO2654583.1 PepSY domain-containing protein [Shewanella algae]TVL34771.1 peptidase [Shewanella algae]HEW9975993.1 PepSY domain-containing protein [Shewanella algae]